MDEIELDSSSRNKYFTELLGKKYYTITPNLLFCRYLPNYTRNMYDTSTSVVSVDKWNIQVVVWSEYPLLHLKRITYIIS